jgi:hypothetical protein
MTFHQRKIITNIEQPGAEVQGGAALFFRMQIADKANRCGLA